MQQREQLQTIAFGAGLMAVIIAIVTGRLPRWLRITLTLGLVILAGGAGLYAYRYYSRPTTLTVAAGSIDGAAPQMMSAIATRLAATGAPVRLKVIDKGTVSEATKAFSSGEVDLAVMRPDVGDLSAAENVVVITRGVVLIVTPPGSSITEIDDLQGKTVGVVGGETNQKVVEALMREYGLDGAKTHFKDVAVPDIAPAIKSKQISALLVVMPLTQKYLTMLRNMFARTGKSKPGLVSIESAGAIAAVTKYYQSYDLPKGTLQGSPPIPDDDMKTLRVPLYLVANKKLSNDVVGSLAKGIMAARRDLIGDPLIAQISEPDTDKSDDDNDTYIPMHPGATAYFSGDEKSFFDKYGDQFFYGSMLLGTLASLFAAAWKFMTKNEEKPENRPLMRLYALTDQIRKSNGEADLADAEERIDQILKSELEKYTTGDVEPAETAALGLATHRLEHLIAQRRALINGKSAAAQP
jgi:TRAP-type uncharacterized transport system substrate-binding protein